MSSALWSMPLLLLMVTGMTHGTQATQYRCIILKGAIMNQQCSECKIRKFCTKDEPKEDWTCDDYVDESDYVRFMDA